MQKLDRCNIAIKPLLICTLLETFDGHGCGVVPLTLPDLPELAMSQLPDKLEAAPVDLPLVPGAVGQVGSDGFLNLQKSIH